MTRRRDGKVYLLDGQLPEAEWQRAVGLVHRYRCRDGLSYRAIVAALEAEGIRASVGSVHAWAHRWRCRYEPPT